MARFIVERTFVEGLEIRANDQGAAACLAVVENNAEEHVTWVTSFVTPDHRRTFCVYDAPDPEAIRRAAVANGLPVDEVTEVHVLDPYFYASQAP